MRSVWISGVRLRGGGWSSWSSISGWLCLLVSVFGGVAGGCSCLMVLLWLFCSWLLSSRKLLLESLVLLSWAAFGLWLADFLRSFGERRCMVP
jgi:hypothetical protein